MVGSVMRPSTEPYAPFQLRKCAAAYAITTAMNAGSTITSRDSHEVRHFAADRHARAGRPRWKNEATSPAPVKANDTSAP